MSTRSSKPITGLVLAVTVFIMLPAATRGSTEDVVASEASYRSIVPEHMKELVGEAQFKRTISSLAGQEGRTPGKPLLSESTVLEVAASPCSESLTYLAVQYLSDAKVRSAFNAVLAGLVDPPPGYGYSNPWKAASDNDELLGLMVETFLDWCVFLPEIDGDQDNGLAYIQNFAWFYYQNQAGQDFVQGRNPLHPSEPLEVGLRFTEDFTEQRGRFMWSEASTACIEQWISDQRIEIVDYQKQQASDYDSWNAFFARNITIDRENQTIPSRPATMPLREYPRRDYIVVSPTDCIMNPLVQVQVGEDGPIRRLIDNPLQYNTVLDVKGIPISMERLLGTLDERYKKQFIGGTGLSCVLMPNTYHHFHAPVNGKVIHKEVLDSYNTFGYFDWANWVPLDGNVGRPGTDFSQFEVFERGVIVIEVTYTDVDGSELTGYVASIPVGLDTIGSVVLADDYEVGDHVKRGYTRLGNFYYGGSLDILLFSKGLATGAVQTRLGNQIGLLNIGTEPPVDPDQPPCKSSRAPR